MYLYLYLYLHLYLYLYGTGDMGIIEKGQGNILIFVEMQNIWLVADRFTASLEKWVGD